MKPLFLIAGPCVIESKDVIDEIAGTLTDITHCLGVKFIFKASYDKANRSSLNKYRGQGIDEGLKTLEYVRATYGCPVITDIHEYTPIAEVASVVDVLQTPAFLCRQTDFIINAASHGKPVNIKKGQFMSPHEMENVVAKAKSTGNNDIWVCERGYMFGYNNLVSDFKGIPIMRKFSPVVFDATHSVQQPGALGDQSGGQRCAIPVLARCAVAAGVDGLFVETHPRPDEALSDGPNSLLLSNVEPLLRQLMEIDALVKQSPFLEDT